MVDCTSYKILNKHLLDIAKSITRLQPVVEEEPVAYLRLQEVRTPISVSYERVCASVVAHDLIEYKNKYHAFQLEENVFTWLDNLLNEGEEA